MKQSQKDKIYEYVFKAGTADKYSMFRYFDGTIAPQTVDRRLRELRKENKIIVMNDKRFYQLNAEQPELF